jgi:hypothetical protein
MRLRVIFNDGEYVVEEEPVNPYDLCSCMRTSHDDVCTIFVYVDDLIIMSGNETSLYLTKQRSHRH